jgi:hypothetical protein
MRELSARDLWYNPACCGSDIALNSPRLQSIEQSSGCTNYRINPSNTENFGAQLELPMTKEAKRPDGWPSML